MNNNTFKSSLNCKNKQIEKEMRAIVTLTGVENSTGIQGVVHLKQETPAGGLTLRGTIRGLTPGKHGQYLIIFIAIPPLPLT